MERGGEGQKRRQRRDRKFSRRMFNLKQEIRHRGSRKNNWTVSAPSKYSRDHLNDLTHKLIFSSKLI